MPLVELVIGLLFLVIILVIILSRIKVIPE